MVIQPAKNCGHKIKKRKSHICFYLLPLTIRSPASCKYLTWPELFQIIGSILHLITVRDFAFCIWSVHEKPPCSALVHICLLHSPCKAWLGNCNGQTMEVENYLVFGKNGSNIEPFLCCVLEAVTKPPLFRWYFRRCCMKRSSIMFLSSVETQHSRPFTKTE